MTDVRRATSDDARAIAAVKVATWRATRYGWVAGSTREVDVLPGAPVPEVQYGLTGLVGR